MSVLPPGFVLDGASPQPDYPAPSGADGGNPNVPRIRVTPINPQHRELAIRTVLGEAANEPDEGMAGVAAVIRNRVQAGRYGGGDIPRVVTAKSQFEPWGTQEGRSRMFGYAPDSEPYKRAAAAVDRVFGEEYDPTGGATHFYSPTAQAALGRAPPKWAAAQEPQNIGRHAFYAPEGRVQAAQAPTDMSSQAWRGDGQLPPGFVLDGAPQAAQGQPAPDPMADNGGQFAAPLPDGQNIRTAREGVSPAVPTAGEAALGGATRSATFNFADELKGVLAAGGLDPKDPTVQDAAQSVLSTMAMPAASIYRKGPEMVAFVKGVYGLISGDPEAQAAYRVKTSQSREQAADQQQFQPGAELAGQLAGGLATVPLTGGAGALGQGAGLGARVGQGVKVGAAYGAAGGAGEGTDLASRVTGAGTGGLTGGLLGGALPVGVEGVVKTGQGISKLASPIVQAVRGVRDPEAEAARRITSALQRDATSGSAGMTPAQFAAERAAGTPVVVGDLGGTATRSLARSAADTSAEGRAALEAVTNERYVTQNPRVSQFIKETFDFPDVGAKLEQIQEAARRANAPAYNKAYREGASGIWDDGLEQFSQAPVMQNAIRSAFLTARNKGAIDGFPPIKNPFTLDKATGVYELKAAEDGSRALPNLQFWDHVKRNLDKVNSPESRAAAEALRNHLDEVVPSYKTARAGAAGWFGAEDALEAGAKFATMGGLDAMKIAQARGQVAKMSGPDRKLFETGFVSNLLAKIESRKDGQDIVKAVFDSQFSRKQIEIALGPEKAALLEARLQTERVMNALKNEVGGNSLTARRLYELGMAGATNPYTLAGAAGGVSSYSTGSVGPGDAFAAGLVFAARKGQIKIDGRIAQKVGEMLASDQPSVVQKGLSLIARNENMKRALRAFDMPAVGASAQQGPGVPALQSMGIGRAEEDQPAVPRPPGQ